MEAAIFHLAAIGKRTKWLAREITVGIKNIELSSKKNVTNITVS